MTLANKQLFLAGYAYELTVLARGCFEDGEFDTARACNETIHRLMGFLVKLGRGAGADSEESFVEMIVAGAQQKGFGQLLLRALQRNV
jgi:hypothetical protein